MLSLAAIDKSYGATRAVKSVTLDAMPGTVLGLVGENGAGKSTLIKIISGSVAPDSGSLSLDGEAIAPRDTTEAIALGISGVFQELTMVSELTVEQNLLLTAAPTTAWRSVDRKKMRQAATDILGRHRLFIDPGTRVGDLALGQQQSLEIVRAVERNPRVLLLDEATSALGASEVEWLAGLIAQLRVRKTLVLFISHRWDEIAHFCNRVAILRNGELVGEGETAAIGEDEAVRLMTGQVTTEASFPDKHPAQEAVVASATDLRSSHLRGVGIALRRGEILGLGGLVGQGQGSLLEAFFGAHALNGGEIKANGMPLRNLTPRRSIAAGFAYVPQERKSEGLLLQKSVAFNLTLATLQRLPAVLGFVDRGAETARVRAAIDRSRIRTRGGQEAIRNLSGGNQQKVLLEKWLEARPAVLLLNDVTRGVDIGTKRHIYHLIADIARQGVGIIWYSTDARELVGVAHRVLVMLQGRVNAELTGEQVTVDNIVRASVVGISGRYEDETRAAR